MNTIETEHHGSLCASPTCFAFVTPGDTWGDDWTSDGTGSLYCADHGDENPMSDTYSGDSEEGVQIDARTFHTRQTVAQINDLIDSLPEDGSVLWLSTDGSWGGATDLTLYDRDTLPEDVLDAYEIDLTAL